MHEVPLNLFTRSVHFRCALACVAVLAILLTFGVSGACAAEQLPTSATAELPYVNEPSWFAPSLAFADSALKSSPPVWPEPVRRVEALMLLDGPLHLEQANRFRSAHKFLIGRLEGAIASMESAKVTTGVKIWKMYNHGFVVRTPSITVAMDVVPGWHAANAYFGISPSAKARFARQIDVLSLSHYHGDHTNPAVKDAALDAGVTILAEASVLTGTQSVPQTIRPSRLDAKLIEAGTTAPVFSVLETKSGKKLEYLAYPGHQGDITNTLYLFRTPEGFTFMHTGDQADPPDFAWIDKIGRQERVDVLFINSWTPNLGRIVQGVRPKLVVMGHEAELGHTPEQRQPYWDSYKAARGCGGIPAIVPGWGETFDYPLRGKSRE